MTEKTNQNEDNWFCLLWHLVFKSCLGPCGLYPTRLLYPWDFPRQEYWSGLPFQSPEDLPNPGIEPGSPALTGGFFTTEPPGKPFYLLWGRI